MEKQMVFQRCANDANLLHCFVGEWQMHMHRCHTMQMPYNQHLCECAKHERLCRSYFPSYAKTNQNSPKYIQEFSLLILRDRIGDALLNVNVKDIIMKTTSGHSRCIWFYIWKLYWSKLVGWYARWHMRCTWKRKKKWNKLFILAAVIWAKIYSYLTQTYTKFPRCHCLHLEVASSAYMWTRDSTNCET